LLAPLVNFLEIVAQALFVQAAVRALHFSDFNDKTGKTKMAQLILDLTDYL
jgi:hypothetical protein